MPADQYMSLEMSQFAKSRNYCSSKYNASLIENKIMALATTKIESRLSEKDSPLIAKLYPGELKRLIGDPTNIYKTLKKVSKRMTGHVIFMEDGKGNFKAFSLVNSADYVDGVFTIEMNKNLRPHILELTGSFTVLELSVLCGLSSTASFRLYEWLKSFIYKSDPNVNDGKVEVECNIAELRFMIGLANADDPVVKQLMSTMGKNVDWDLLYKRTDKKSKKYEKWYDFKRYVLIPAQKEFIEKSNLRFDFEGIQTKGHAYTHIRFWVYKGEPTNPEIIDEKRKYINYSTRNNRQLEMPMDIYPEVYEKFVGHNGISKEDLDVLMFEAQSNVSLVENAFAYVDSKKHTNNYMGYLVHYIQNGGYDEPIETEYGSKEKAEETKEMMKEMNSRTEEEITKTAYAVWETVKKREEFPLFERFIERNLGLPVSYLEDTWSIKELVQKFYDWKVNYEHKEEGRYGY